MAALLNVALTPFTRELANVLKLRSDASNIVFLLNALSENLRLFNSPQCGLDQNAVVALLMEASKALSLCSEQKSELLTEFESEKADADDE
jgi:hypothetical protein